MREYLRDLTQTVTKERDEAVARVHENRGAIEHFWEEAGRPAPNSIEWAKAQAARDVSALQQQADLVGSLERLFKGRWTSANGSNPHRPCSHRPRRLGALANKVLTDCLATVLEGAGDVVGVLEAAARFLERNPDPTACPLCESSAAVAGLAARVAARLHDFTSLRRARDASAAAAQSTRTARGRVSDAEQDASRRIAKTRVRCRVARGNARDCLRRLRVRISRLTSLPGLAPTAVSFKAGSKQSGASRRHEVLEDEPTIGTYDQNVLELEEIERLLPRLKRSLDVIVEERQTFTDAVLSQISVAVGELVRGGAPRRRAEQDRTRTRFDEACDRRTVGLLLNEGNATTEGASSSQSHLDTLGLCVFLRWPRLIARKRQSSSTTSSRASTSPTLSVASNAVRGGFEIQTLHHHHAL